MRVNRVRPRTFCTGRRALIGLGSFLAVGLMVSLATVARAAGTPTSMELLDKCNNGTDVCQFHVSGAARTFYGPSDVSSQTTANCTDKNQTATIGWSKSTMTSNSLGISMSASGGPAGVFEAGYKIAYQHEWTKSITNGENVTITIPAGHVGRIFVAREMEEVSGQYELHFGSKFYDHYYWYVPMTVTSPKTGGKDGVVPKSDPMTSEERAKYCSG